MCNTTKQINVIFPPAVTAEATKTQSNMNIKNKDLSTLIDSDFYEGGHW